MTDTRLKRRIVGALSKRLREARLDEVNDPRDPRGRRWKLGTLLGAALLGLVAGCRSLLQVEALTEDLSPPTRQRFGLARRLPDTTLHNLLWQLQPQQVLPVLHRVVRAAHRRRALVPDELPFGVVSLDGKSTAVPACDDYYAQRQSQHQGQCLGLVRTISAVLTSSPARPYLHVTPVPASTNVPGHLPASVRRVDECLQSGRPVSGRHLRRRSVLEGQRAARPLPRPALRLWSQRYPAHPAG